MADKIYPKGLVIKPPRSGAPSFVKAKMGINVPDFTAFLEQHAKENGWVDFDILDGREGLYCVLNQWTKEPVKKEAEIKWPDEDINPDDVPF